MAEPAQHELPDQQQAPPAKRLKTAAAAATTPQPGVPRYVVPPATGDLVFGRSHWDRKPAEIHAIILKAAGPLTLFVNGLLGDKDTLDEATKRAVWIDAFKMDWQGDLDLLPLADLTADNGLLLAHSRSMYDRLCKCFPKYTEAYGARDDARNNNYHQSIDNTYFDSRRLILIPMRHGWFDLLDFSYPITLAQMAIRFGCLDLLEHLDREYNILQGGMAKRHLTSPYWRGAIDKAAQYGHLDVVHYLFDAGVMGCTTRAMDYAARNGRLDIVQFLHSHRNEGCTTEAMDYSVRNGHLHVVKWLHENRTEGGTTDAKYDAASYGHLDIVQFLHESGRQVCTPGPLDEAISMGHTDIVRYMHSVDVRTSSNVIERVAAWGNAEMLQCLRELENVYKPRAVKPITNTAITAISQSSSHGWSGGRLLAHASQDDCDAATAEGTPRMR